MVLNISTMIKRQKPGPKKQDTVAINLRLPRGLHSRLAHDAAHNSPPHSLNYEIIERLTRSVEAGDLAAKYENAADAWMETIRELQARVAQLEAERSK